MSHEPPFPDFPEQALRDTLATPALRPALREQLLRIPQQYPQLTTPSAARQAWPLWWLAGAGLAGSCAVLGFVLGLQGMLQPATSLDWVNMDWAALAYGSI